MKKLYFLFFLFSCTKVYKIQNPKEKFVYYLEKNTKGRLVYILTKGDVEIYNEFYFKGRFKFEADSENVKLIFLSPFGANKDAGKVKDRLFLLSKIFFSPLSYLKDINVLKGYKKGKSEVFELEGGIEIYFNTRGKFKILKFPDFKLSVVWKDSIPYNIKMDTKDLKMNIFIKKLKTRFEK